MVELPGSGLSALVVDDDPAIRTLLRSVLELDGWSVGEASDGDEALDRAAAEWPDGIVLDVMMPGRDGFGVLAELRATEHGRRSAIVMLTAKSQPADVYRGTRLGADLYLTKPFEPDAVSTQLATHVLRRNPGARR